jgi:Cu-Zn family superoxide dismutase
MPLSLKPLLHRLALPLGATLLAACSLMPDMPSIGIMGSEGPPESALAQVTPTQGSEVSGQVKFTRRGEDTLVEVSLSHLSPGEHGFHIHEKGDCSAPDGLSAGGHFNPTGLPHGGLDGTRHEGDLGNLLAAADGTVNVNFHVRHLELSGDHGVIGRAVIVHAAADDLKTQPSGNSGKRLACGTIVHS